MEHGKLAALDKLPFFRPEFLQYQDFTCYGVHISVNPSNDALQHHKFFVTFCKQVLQALSVLNS